MYYLNSSGQNIPIVIKEKIYVYMLWLVIHYLIVIQYSINEYYISRYIWWNNTKTYWNWLKE